MNSTSKIVDQMRESERIAQLRHSEITVGELIGKGGFSDVFEVLSIDLQGPLLGNTSHESQMEYEQTPLGQVREQVRQAVAEKSVVHKKERSRDGYVIKFLRRSVMNRTASFRTGAKDLALEYKILSSLDHPNIIQLRGVAEAGVNGFASGAAGGFFLVLDRLETTLDARMNSWSNNEKKLIKWSKLQDRKGGKRKALVKSRIKVALDIATAMEYLHSRNIIFRDIKPENIGFLKNGVVQLFDFGLAKELIPETNKRTDGNYKLTGNTGSLRYMAPEIARREPYNLSADAYSFAILLWEMITLEVPYHNYNQAMHSSLVVYGTERPPIDQKWSSSIKELLAKSFSPKALDRPTFSTTTEILREEIDSNTKMNTDSSSMSGLSTHSQLKVSEDDKQDNAPSLDRNLSKLRLDQVSVDA
jgi:serine/threonine protein kinase